MRAGNKVTLHWTTPAKTTDHLLIRGVVGVSVCRRERAAQACIAVGSTSSSPHTQGEFDDFLPASLVQGSPRELTYFVELLSPAGQSAGSSNAAIILAGQAPGPVSDLSAEVRADGVALLWDNTVAADQSTEVRLHRRLLTVGSSPRKSKSSVAENGEEPVFRDLLAPPPGPGQRTGALDTSIHFGQSYEYTAQRVVQVALATPEGKQTFEMEGPVSPPVRISVIDRFPPAVPQDLAAVYVPEQHSIDLSWQPDTEPDLAGYIVYRSTDGNNWVRLSGPAPVGGPAYRDPTVERGQVYRYAVSAIDQTGHESKRSSEAIESTPAD